MLKIKTTEAYSQLPVVKTVGNEARVLTSPPVRSLLFLSGFFLQVPEDGETAGDQLLSHLFLSGEKQTPFSVSLQLPGTSTSLKCATSVAARHCCQT
ncbi:hypothetical protein AV530_000637 [Patagioenas fasciata monilis]|uniref:Uncharacterized protein n=1 Tax=Patagioenas fasciata monilis TaxID=372326 RepID=A0A1V4IFX7_PATFA|nr:hypothetical protein AV530_000637 [Patagioenas fasciata monilis]